MKPNLWKSPYYKKILQIMAFSNFGVLFVVLLALFISFYVVTSRYLDSINQHFLNNVAANVHYQINRSQENALNIYLSYSGTALLASRDDSNDAFVRDLKELDSFITKDPLIHSVYLLNAGTGKIITLGSDLSRLDTSNFIDADTLRQMLKPDPSGFLPYAHYAPNSSYHAVNSSYVFTYIFKMTSNHIMAVNLRVNQLFEILQTNPSAYNTARSNFIVFSGLTPIYSSFASDSLENIDSSVILGIISENEEKSSISARINNTKYHFNIHSDPESNLTYVSLIENSDIYKSFHYQQILFIAIGLAGGVMALILSVILSKKFYVPIGKMRSLLTLHGRTDTANDNEIDFITQSIIENSKNLETLHEYKSSTLNISQTSLIKKQLLYNAYSDEEFLEQCEKRELPYSPGDSSVLIYSRWYTGSRQGCNEMLKNSDHALLSYAISNVFHELVEGAQIIYDISFENEGMAFWCCFDAPPVHDDLQSALSGIQRTFDQYFNIRLSFFISGNIKTPSDMYTAMQQLERISQYQYFYPDSCILHPADIDIEQRLSELCPLPQLDALEKALRSGEWESCQKVLQPFFDDIYNYSYEAAKASLSMFATKLITLIKKITENQPSFPEIAPHMFFREVMDAPNLLIAQQIILAPMKSLVNALASPSNDTINLLAGEVQRYLAQNYHTYNISSKSIAQHHHISVPYLNRIFKQKTGDTIAAYIKKLRLQSARQILISTNLPVESVAKKVGFENTKYFYSLFKTEYGESPSSYRISHSINTSKTS